MLAKYLKLTLEQQLEKRIEETKTELMHCKDAAKVEAELNQALEKFQSRMGCATEERSMHDAL